RSEAYFVFPLAQGTPGKQCGLAATGVYQPSLRSPWLAADVGGQDGSRRFRHCHATQTQPPGNKRPFCKPAHDTGGSSPHVPVKLHVRYLHQCFTREP
ncbi:hypothetical protein, partial [Thiolapillus sp.]|uniref:hypothetical protein n=1 Tax=Thiolapillus sp. TaxID=2017437 RepID=UPI003AF71B25